MMAVEAVKEKFYCFLGIVHPTYYQSRGWGPWLVMGALRLTWGTQMLVLHHWDPWHLYWSWYKLWHCIPLAPGTAATHLGTHALGLLVPARHQLGWWPLTGAKTHWLVHNMVELQCAYLYSHQNGLRYIWCIVIDVYKNRTKLQKLQIRWIQSSIF